jgi:hypothetical protein
MNQRNDDLFESQSQNFGDEFDGGVQEGDRSVVPNNKRALLLRDQGNKGRVYAPEANMPIGEAFTKIIEILSYDRPAFFSKNPH